MKQWRLLTWVSLISAALMTSGCVSLAAVEPVSAPPSQFRSDAVADVEFLPSADVGRRCAQRGGKVFGMPAVWAMACANTRLMTMPDPCTLHVKTSYSNTLCEILNQSDDSESDAQPNRETLIRMEFLQSDHVAHRCLQRRGQGDANPMREIEACRNSVMITIGNPCWRDKPDWYANLFCHELGHVNGWPANHANVRKRSMAMVANPSGMLTSAQGQSKDPAMRMAEQTILARDPIRFVTTQRP